MDSATQHSLNAAVNAAAQQTQSQSPASIAAAAAAAAAAAQQKRARTRISDDQLKILRAHFDTNNSPSEEQVCEHHQLNRLLYIFVYINIILLRHEKYVNAVNRGFPRNFVRAPNGALAQIFGRHFLKYGRPCL